MNVLKNTKTLKKLIIVLILLILFNFCCPKRVNAGIGFDDIQAAPAAIFYSLEVGVLKFLNNIFTNDNYQSETITEEIASEDADGGSFTVERLKIALTPETIIKGKFLLMDANIFKDINSDSGYYDWESGGDVQTGKSALRGIVSGWYYSLRNFAIIALLSVLVYVAIRMIISTIAQDKAKYKMMFKDWFIALCLLIFMHYIMIGILNISSLITDAIGGGANTDHISELTEVVSGVLQENYDDEEGTWFNANSYKYSKENEDGTTTTYTLGDAYAYILVLAGIIIYTFIFAVKYLKREFTIIFLILLGPISCITYPIDKISDGKAQAYNRWFTEFLYQVIIQPFHLLLYVVLIGSATQLASTNVIYTLICFAIMIPAEKFIKEMFGFKDKLGSPIGAMATGALAGKALSALMKGGKGSGGGKNEGGDNDSAEKELPPRTVDKDGLVEGNSGTGSGDGANNGNRVRSTENNNQLPEGDQTTKQDTTDNEGTDDPYKYLGEGEDPSLEDPNYMYEHPDEYEYVGNNNTPEKIDKTGEKPKEEKPIDNEEQKTLQEQSMWDKMKSTHNQRMVKKWGSTSRSQRWKNRGKRAIRSLPGLAKGAAIGAVGAAAISGALLTGNGKEALGIAGGIGAYAGKKAWSGGKKAIKGATGAFKNYYGDLRDDGQREKKAFKDFQADKAQVDKAVYSYRKNHDGVDPNGEQLNKEMEDRFTLSRYGLTDDQIDDALPIYQEKLEELKKDGKDEEQAQNIAASQAKYAANLAKWYSPKDFMDPKKMENAYDTVKAGLMEQTNCDDLTAGIYAGQYLRNAGVMSGLKRSQVKLPATAVDVDVATPRVISSLGLNASELTSQQIQQVGDLTVKIHDKGGFSKDEINVLAQNTSGRGGDKIANFENIVNTSIEYVNEGYKSDSLSMSMDDRKERVMIASSFNLDLKKNKSTINKVKEVESKSEVKQKTQIQASRELVNKHGRKIGEEQTANSERKQLIKEITRDGKVSTEKAGKDADNIVKLAQQQMGVLND